MEQEFLKDIIVRLEKTGVTYAITGSIASSLWGIPWTTPDVAIVVLLTAAEVARIVAAFADRYSVSEPAVRDAVARNTMFTIVNSTTAFKTDLWVTSDDPFNQSMLSRRCRLEVVPEQEAFVGSPEDVLLHKLVWNRITPSERQLADAAGIAAVQAGKLDLDYLRRWAAQQSTADVLEAVLQGKYLQQT